MKPDSAKGMPTGLRRVGLAAVLLMAVLIRLPGTQWGYGLVGDHVDYVQLHPDEPRFVEIARGLHKDVPFRRSYVLGLGSWQRVWLAAAEGGGRVLTDRELVLVARATSVAAGVALVWVLYLLVARLTRSTRWALLAAALAGVNTWCITQSAYGTADMLYTLWLYLFALLVLCGLQERRATFLLVASGVAGVAMATKFGVVLLPSLVWMGLRYGRARRHGWVAVFLLVSAVAFMAAQGFSFNGESVREIRRSFVGENAAGAGAQWLTNPVVCAVELLRVVGLPAAALALLGLGRLERPRRGHFPMAALIAFLPIALHAIGLLFMRLPFPRHILPLVPLALMATAVGVGGLHRSRRVAVVVVLLWSGVLALTDAQALWRDARGKVFEWMAANQSQDTGVWADPYFKLPWQTFYPAAPSEAAGALVLHEGWTYRFGRSELNPFAAPEPGALYHATARDAERHEALLREWSEGRLVVAARAAPPEWLPEQWLYTKLWGHLNKFAGECILLRRVTP
jgi:hypothetical protein